MKEYPRITSHDPRTKSVDVSFSEFYEIEVTLFVTDIYDIWPRIKRTLKESRERVSCASTGLDRLAGPVRKFRQRRGGKSLYFKYSFKVDKQR
ncbi:MAG TPA: hypothetical protein VMW72_03570 [Sedimentisphaerales bacterium]|nr:hypothetical protein [Sedimentisphaerales bacterium]